MRPLIALFADVDNDLNNSTPNTYVKAIEMAGGLPVLLPYVADEQTLALAIERCDGFCFTGGHDIDPARYGEEKKPTCGGIRPRRDELEFTALRLLLSTGKPILGICRGAQLINAGLGGTLYQDLPTENPSRIAHRQTEGAFDFSHSVTPVKDTPLSRLVGEAPIAANSFHHQSVKTLGHGLTVMATADDGVVEAFYLDGAQYLRAYQWHPERLVDTDANSRLLFADFIAACSRA